MSASTTVVGWIVVVCDAAGMVMVFGVIPMFTIVLAIGIGLAIACYRTSTFDTKPRYHDVSYFIYLRQ